MRVETGGAGGTVAVVHLTGPALDTEVATWAVAIPDDEHERIRFLFADPDERVARSTTVRGLVGAPAAGTR